MPRARKTLVSLDTPLTTTAPHAACAAPFFAEKINIVVVISNTDANGSKTVC
jgi:hypothetical protein